MDYKIITHANSAPVSVDELNTHLQLFGDDSYDEELQDMIFAAQGFVDDCLGEYVSNTVIQVSLDSFGDFVTKHRNVKSVAVSYFDANNALQTLDTASYVVDPTGIKTRIAFKETPVVSSDFAYPVQVQYTTGFDVVPAQVRHAILLAAGELFESRSEGNEKARARAMICVDRLLSANKRVVV